jgi:hypothetical protein
MTSVSLQAALQILNTLPSAPSAVSRELVMAYAVLCAWVQHWPSQATPAAQSLIQSCMWIRAAEPDRYIKQRRIALAQLAKELC